MFPSLECREVSRLLWDYVAGPLAESEKSRVERHLCECRPCREQVHEYRQVASLLRAYRSEPAPVGGDDWEPLRAALEAEREAAAAPLRFPRRGDPSLPAAFAWGMATVLLLALLVLETRWHRPQPGPIAPGPDATQNIVQRGPTQRDSPLPKREAPQRRPKKSPLLVNNPRKKTDPRIAKASIGPRMAPYPRLQPTHPHRRHAHERALALREKAQPPSLHTQRTVAAGWAPTPPSQASQSEIGNRKSEIVAGTTVQVGVLVLQQERGSGGSIQGRRYVMGSIASDSQQTRSLVRQHQKEIVACQGL
jgi:hypothetical protein